MGIRYGLGRGLALVAGVTMLAAAGPATAHPAAHAKHVLVISVDGMHQGDLQWWVGRHPASALAALVHRGTDYTNAATTFPSDSFPGMVAQFTGASPSTAGVYYDDTYNHSLLPPGTKDCSTATPGTEVAWTEAADRSQDPITLDAGQGLTDPALTALPSNTAAQTVAAGPAITRAILAMTPTPQTLLDPAALPVDPRTCLPVYPHQYLKVNTVFEVARQHGLRTAWSDKHAAYEILNGPSGSGIQDLFTPEINSVADATGDDWTTDNALTQVYDGTKVAAVLNEIDGYDHSGRRRVGTPAIFGLNFQTLSTAQKLPTSDGLTGGYTAAGRPGPLVTRALGYVDRQVGRLVDRLHHDGLDRSTTVILSAKHGQAPEDPTTLRRIDDGAIVDGINHDWTAAHPGAPDLVSFSVADDVLLLWLSDRRSAATAFVGHWLETHAAPANLITDPTGTFSTSVPASGLRAVYTGRAAARYLHADPAGARTPDVVGVVRPGVVYTGKTKKIAEHGGAATEDRHVPLIVAGPTSAHRVIDRPVATAQIGPTILALLGLDPRALSGARRDHTRPLP